LAHLAREVEAQGHGIRVFQGEDLRLALFEEGLPVPDPVAAMARALGEAHGAILVSPEYNAGIPGHLKNAVDWLSVQQPSPWAGLPVLVASASPGAFGGARGVLAWRATLANLGCWVAPSAITVPQADRTLAEDGTPVEERTAASVRQALTAFLAGAGRSTGRP
jgi:NAD(P)H-dependent FMN reductase